MKCFTLHIINLKYESFTFWNNLLFHHILFFFLDVPVLSSIIKIPISRRLRILSRQDKGSSGVCRDSFFMVSTKPISRAQQKSLLCDRQNHLTGCLRWRHMVNDSITWLQTQLLIFSYCINSHINCLSFLKELMITENVKKMFKGTVNTKHDLKILLKPMGSKNNTPLPFIVRILYG